MSKKINNVKTIIKKNIIKKKGRIKNYKQKKGKIWTGFHFKDLVAYMLISS